MLFSRIAKITGGRIILLPVFIILASFDLAAAIKKVTVLSTCDIHAAFNAKGNSWLKLGVLIREQRRKAGKDNCLLIDCGDTLQGSYPGMFTRGMVSLKMLNALNYDIWVPGNHDFDFGVKRMLTIARDFKGSVLAGNVSCPEPFKSYKVFNRGGLKVAVIGLGCCNPSSYDPVSLRGIELEVADKYLSRAMRPVAASKPEIIILSMHNGRFSKKPDLFKLLRRFPEINLVLGAHSHAEEPGVSSGHSWFMQSGSHARFLGKAVIEYDTDARKLSIKSELIPVSNNARIDSNSEKLISTLLEESDKAAQEVVGVNSFALKSPRSRKKPSGISRLFCEAISVAAKADVAFHDTPTRKAELRKGSITGYDIFRLMPYQNTVCTLKLNREQIAAIIKEQYHPAGRTRRFLHFTGMTVKLTRDGDLLGNPVLKDGSELRGDRKIKIAFSSYALTGAGGRWPYLKSLSGNDQCSYSDTNIQIRKILENYIKSHSPLNMRPVNNIRYIKQSRR